MSLVYASASLQGVAYTAANGDMFLQTAAVVSGDAEVTSNLRGIFTGAGVAMGDAVVSPTGSVSQRTEASFVGEATLLVSQVLFLVGASLDGEASTEAPAQLVAAAATDVLGDASVEADAGVVVSAATDVLGDASVGADAEVIHAAEAVISGDAQVSATCLADDEIASDAVGGSVLSGESEVAFAAVAEVAGGSFVAALAIVRQPQVVRILPSDDAPPLVRYVGYQPGREMDEQRQAMSLVTDSQRIQQLNQEASRQTPSVVRKDTGTSSVVVTRKN